MGSSSVSARAGACGRIGFDAVEPERTHVVLVDVRDGSEIAEVVHGGRFDISGRAGGVTLLLELVDEPGSVEFVRNGYEHTEKCRRSRRRRGPTTTG